MLCNSDEHQNTVTIRNNKDTVNAEKCRSVELPNLDERRNMLHVLCKGYALNFNVLYSMKYAVSIFAKTDN